MKNAPAIALMCVLIVTAPRAQTGEAKSPNKEVEVVSYYLPFAYGEQQNVWQGNDQAPSHNKPWSRYCFDFSPLPEGSPVHAAASGTVVFVKRDTPGPTGSPQDNNEIAVGHKDGTVAQYLHLRQGGALVAVGDKILAGDLLGYSGNTGMSTAPHLCFGLRDQHRLGRSVQCRFRDTGKGGVPETGDRVVSRNFPLRELLGELVALEQVATLVANTSGFSAIADHYHKVRGEASWRAIKRKITKVRKHRPDLEQFCQEERDRILAALEARFRPESTPPKGRHSAATTRYERELKKALLAELKMRASSPGIASKDAEDLVKAYLVAHEHCVDPVAAASISEHVESLRKRLE